MGVGKNLKLNSTQEKKRMRRLVQLRILKAPTTRLTPQIPTFSKFSALRSIGSFVDPISFQKSFSSQPTRFPKEYLIQKVSEIKQRNERDNLPLSLDLQNWFSAFDNDKPLLEIDTWENIISALRFTSTNSSQ